MKNNNLVNSNSRNNNLRNNNLNKSITTKINIEKLKIDCDNCFGLCCVALYFSISDGFPVDKVGGQPCPNLQEDYRCRVHGDLNKLGLKGCRAYDCFGAGQKISLNTFKRKSWMEDKELSVKMFDCFLIMRQLHELLWYLTQAAGHKATASIKGELISSYIETENMANSGPAVLLQLDVAAYRQKVNILLLRTSELVRTEIFLQMQNLGINNFRTDSGNSLAGNKSISPGQDLIGTDLRKIDLRGANLRGAYLIGADLRGCSLQGGNLIGVDLRDADIRDADLSESIFLTQSQLNVAKGNSDTKLPDFMTRPVYWEL